MLKKSNKKKKGFTLIELVIVLAVLAIIALIAIPNFTKVRNDSLQKADDQTIEQIKDITLMAIASEYIDVPTSSAIGKYSVDKEGEFTGDTGSFKTLMKDVNGPQVNGVNNFNISINSESEVTVTTGTESIIVD